MAGRIRASDIEEVKRRVNLADLVGDYVSLKNAGIDSMKGLCPFHDERSPSFHVRPALGYYHCFGCGESGDAFTFLQRHDHLSFTESVERLATKTNYQLTYEEGGDRREEGPNRARLLAANQASSQFFVAQLAGTEGETARDFLTQRGFDAAACERFQVGYSPNTWDSLMKHLSTLGYSRDELIQAGLVSAGQRGVYDRFRGRVMWPIIDASGQTLGFGARKLYDDDQGPKYLNTPDSPVYRKSRVLYGIDQAKKAISRGRRAVIVEGYTDVMACHLAGVETAVATCGTAFGPDHISMLRRMMGDDASAEVIFTFDPDEAGQKAALRAFSEEQRFSAQTYVAVAPDGYDPSDLRLHRGDEAVRKLFEQKVPLFEFALRQAVSRFDLNSVEGRVAGLREAAPIISRIKDPSLRPSYTRELSRMLGMDLGEVRHAVNAAGQQSQVQARTQSQTGSHAQARPQSPASSQSQSPTQSRATGARARVEDEWPQDSEPESSESDSAHHPRIGLSSLRSSHETWLERDALMAMLQQPEAVGIDLLTQAVTAQVFDAHLVVVRDAIARALPGFGGPDFVTGVLNEAPKAHEGLVRELLMAPMPQRRPDQLAAYSRDVVVSLLDRDLLSLKRELVARMQRIGDSGDPGSRRIQEQLMSLESARRSLRDRP